MPPYQQPTPIQGPDFLREFMAGWSLAQQRKRMAMEQQAFQADMEREAFDRQQRQEALKLQKQEIDLRMKRARQEDAIREFEFREKTQLPPGLPPPTAEDVGIQQAVPDVGPDVSQINVPQPTQAVPSMLGGPDIQAPILTGRQQQEMALAEQQAKMREALGMLEAGEGIKAKYREPKTPESETAAAWKQQPDGSYVNVFTGATRGKAKPPDATAAKGKAPTAAQARAEKFWKRGADALKNLDKVVGTGPDAMPLENKIARAGTVSQWWMGVANNALLSPEQRQYIQAAKTFTEARLRQDSGAAIPKEEYARDLEMFFVQPGDDSGTIAQKKASRQSVLDALLSETGAETPPPSGDTGGGNDPLGIR